MTLRALGRNFHLLRCAVAIGRRL